MAEKNKNTYVAILRGINVSGKNIMKMPALVKVFESLELENVRTYIQSGNVVFNSELFDSGELEKRIHDQINNEF